MGNKRYSITLPPAVDESLARLGADLGVSKGEVIRRALVLYEHAIKADEVLLKTGSKTRAVLLK